MNLIAENLQDHQWSKGIMPVLPCVNPIWRCTAGARRGWCPYQKSRETFRASLWWIILREGAWLEKHAGILPQADDLVR